MRAKQRIYTSSHTTTLARDASPTNTRPPCTATLLGYSNSETASALPSSTLAMPPICLRQRPLGTSRHCTRALSASVTHRRSPLSATAALPPLPPSPFDAGTSRADSVEVVPNAKAHASGRPNCPASWPDSPSTPTHAPSVARSNTTRSLPASHTASKS